MSLVTLDLAKQHLRVDGNAEDTLIAVQIAAAEGAAVEHLNRKVYENQAALDAAVTAGTAGTDPIVVNDLIRAAILLILGSLYENREDGDVPDGAHNLLQPYRVGMGV